MYHDIFPISAFCGSKLLLFSFMINPAVEKLFQQVRMYTLPGFKELFTYVLDRIKLQRLLPNSWQGTCTPSLQYISCMTARLLEQHWDIYVVFYDEQGSHNISAFAISCYTEAITSCHNCLVQIRNCVRFSDIPNHSWFVEKAK